MNFNNEYEILNKPLENCLVCSGTGKDKEFNCICVRVSIKNDNIRMKFIKHLIEVYKEVNNK